ncbi:collagen-binding domain-containing protein [Rhodobacter maris]|uniref:Choice-of-anchor A domain-containing protein n=1 Tax=Rhodobacter maris TaxID=446682 RepID=A0A285SNA7_9RHOB|nr:collagen-binding domain-containing protein [Rhodobacter maris]SOC09270.1 choice-of-anchor A domain-containing protein [Rhodobacter maris]
MNLKIVFAMVAGLGAAFAGVAGQAATLDAAQLLNQYNLISIGNVVAYQEVEGNVYIGGDLNGSTMQADFVQGVEPDPSLADVVILGDQNAILNLDSDAASTVVIGGSSNNWVNNLGAGSLTVGSLPAATVLDSSEVFATLTAASAALASLAPTATYTETEQGYIFGAGIFTVSLNDLTKNEITFALSAGETAIINVIGDVVSFSKNFVNTDYALASQVIWNFVNATVVELNSKLIGAVLAPTATVSGFSGSMEGSLFASSVNLTNGEIHYQGFTGTLPIVENNTPPAVPLPASLPLLFGGIGLTAFLRRNRKTC